MKNTLRQWYMEDLSGMEEFLETEERPDVSRASHKSAVRAWEDQLLANPQMQSEIHRRQLRWHKYYRVIAVLSCLVFIAIMLYMIAHLPQFGFDNPRADIIARRYIEEGLRETGAVNVVAGMILDYRAFDTLGESFVLFTALVCATILLRFGVKDSSSVVQIEVRQEVSVVITSMPLRKSTGSSLTPGPANSSTLFFTKPLSKVALTSEMATS